MSSNYILSFIKEPSNLNLCTDLVTFLWQEEPSYVALLFSSCKKTSGNYIFHKITQHAGGALNKHSYRQGICAGLGKGHLVIQDNYYINYSLHC